MYILVNVIIFIWRKILRLQTWPTRIWKTISPSIHPLARLTKHEGEWEGKQVEIEEQKQQNNKIIYWFKTNGNEAKYSLEDSGLLARDLKGYEVQNWN
jgi:hypothetical protein